jgi:para-nitrobenzyl esterase
MRIEFMTKTLFYGLVALVTSTAPLCALQQPVKTRSGLVSGVPGKDPAILAFKGIPFAAPPVGDLRWRAPGPVAAWEGVRRADQFGASCAQTIAPRRLGTESITKPGVYDTAPQTDEFAAHNEASEDCLYLNVWTAAKSASEKRPVFVYIYGGGFDHGSGDVPIYDGEGLAKKGLVVVTLNYRVGMIGFFVHPELTKESGHNASGNYGLLDQIAALKWIQDNIAAFGGDPNRVTIAGQSAGGMSVHALIASPLARGLFHRAIVESGGSTVGRAGISINASALADAEAAGQRFAEAKGAKSIAELRAMSWQKLNEPPAGAAGRGRGARDTGAPAAAGAPGGGRAGMPDGGRGSSGTRSPIVDGYVLPAAPNEVVAQGKQNDVPILTGMNLGELGGISPSQVAVTLESFRNQARQRYGDDADKFLALYPASNDQEAAAAQAQASRDQSLVSLYLWAKMRSKTAKTKAFDYLWDHSLPGPDAARFGAFHTGEVPYVLNTLYASPRPFTDVDRKLAGMMSSYWANFAANGNPNGKGLPLWPAYSGKAEIMELGDKTGPIPAADSAAKQAFFEAFLTRP